MIFDWIQTRVQQSENGPWVPLSHRQQEQMFKVVRLWEGAAEQGHVGAQSKLGFIYQHGQGVDVDYKKAIEWYEKAAKQGQPEAQFNLAGMYAQGRGVDVN